MSAQAQPRYLRDHEAVIYLREKRGIPETKQGLAKKRVYGGGPRFRKYGRYPLYAEEDLDAYARDSVSGPVRSTAELPAPHRERKA